MSEATLTQRKGVFEALQIKPEETNRTALLFFYLFLCSVVFTMGRTARDALFLSAYPSKWLPHMFVGYGLASAIITPFYAALNDKFRRDKFNAIFCLILSASYILAWSLIRSRWSPVYPSLYIWVEVTNNLLIVQFWTLANDLHDPREAKRLFGVIGSSRMIGIVVCGLAVGALVQIIGTPMLLILNAAILIIIAVVVTRIGRSYLKTPQVVKTITSHPEKKADRSSMWGSRYVRLIVAMIVFTFIAATIGDYQFKIIARENYQADKLAAFFALFYSAVGATAFFFHFFASSRILARFGVIIGLLAMPILMGVSGTWLILSGGVLLAAAALKFSDNAFQFTINDASLQLLYYPFPQSLKARFKATLEGAVKPVSYGLGGFVLIFLAGKLGPVKLTYITLPLIAFWIITLMFLRPYYVKALINSLTSRHTEPGGIEIIATPEVIRELSNSAKSENDYLYEFAINELEKLSVEEAKQTLLDLLAEVPKRKEAALLELANLGIAAEQARPYLHDPDVNVRAAAIWALASALEENSVEEIAPFLKSPDPAESDAACAALISFAELDGMLVAGDSLRKLLEGDEVGRVRAARILSRAGVREFYRPIRKLMGDKSLDVRKEAIKASGALRKRNLLDDLIVTLADPKLRALAAEAIEHYGDRALDKLGEALGNEKIPLTVRERIPRLLRKINRVEAATVLWSHADTPNERLRIPILHHGERLREKWSLVIDRSQVRKLLENEGVSAARWLERWKNLRPYVSDTLVEEGLDQAIYWCGRRTVSLLRLLYGADAIGRVRYNLESDNTPLRASALETLDNLLSQDEREWIVPLMDSTDRSKAAKELARCFPSGKETAEETVRNIFSGQYQYFAAALFRAKICDGEQISKEIISEYARKAEGVLLEELLKASLRFGYDVSEIESAAKNTASAQAIKLLENYRICVSKNCSDPMEEHLMLTTLERVLFLRRAPIFAGVPAEDLARLAQEATIEEFDENEDIFRRNDPGDAMYLIVRGKVRVRIEEQELARLGEEDFFGEMALLDQEPRSATVTALEKAVLLKIAREDFFEIMADRPEIAKGVLKVLSKRLRKADDEIKKLARNLA